MKALGRRTAVTATIATAALVLAACGGDSDTTDPEASGSDGPSTPTGTMVYGESTGFPENLNPLIAAGNSTATANILIRILPAPFNTLPDFSIAYDEDVMASEPEVAVDGETQTVTYEIAEDAVWSDDTPITAADFAFTWRLQRSSDPADGGCASLLGTTGYDQISDVTDDDGKSVTVTYDSLFPDWKSLFTLFPAHVLDQGDDAANCDATTTGWPIADGIPQDISGGPWQLLAESVDAGAKVLTLTPNPNWWGEPTGLAALTYQDIGSEASTTVSALQNGEVNLVNPQPQLDLTAQIENLAPDVTSSTDFGLSFEHFDMNLQNVHLAKPEVRKAFALALDRPALVAGTVGQFDDRAQVLNNRFYVNNQPEYEDTAPAEYNAQDIDGAKQLLESVGYTLNADGIYEHPQDGLLQLTMSTTQNNPLRESTIDLATSQVAGAGISIEKFLDADIFAGADKPTSLEARGFDIALFAWVSSPYVSGNVSLYETGGGQNYAGVSNTEVDDLLTQLSTEVDSDVAADLANQADAILWDEMGTIPLYQKPIFTAWSADYDGIIPNATNAGPVWNSDKFALVS